MATHSASTKIHLVLRSISAALQAAARSLLSAFALCSCAHEANRREHTACRNPRYNHAVTRVRTKGRTSLVAQRSALSRANVPGAGDRTRRGRAALRDPAPLATALRAHRV